MCHTVRYFFVFGIWLWIPMVHADTYPPSTENALWTFVQQARISCTLHHPISQWGWASFISHAGKAVNLQLKLHPKLTSTQRTEMLVSAMPPYWKAGHSGYAIDRLSIFPTYDYELKNQQAWDTLDALKQGFFVSFQFQNTYHRHQETRVLLSPLNFTTPWNDFTDCVDQLLPYSFEDIGLSVLEFELNSDDLTLESLALLKKIGDFVRWDPYIERIEVRGYSDSYGGRWHNQVLSERRAQRIKAYLVQQGFSEKLIETIGYGERRHISANDIALLRAKNRRVVIELFRNPGKDEQAMLPVLPPMPKPKASVQQKSPQSEPKPDAAATQEAQNQNPENVNPPQADNNQEQAQ